MLGLQADASARTLRVERPRLPENVGQLELRGMRVGEAAVDLRFERVGEEVRLDASVRHGDLTVETV
ncbi:MAG: hypothetical protein AUH85_03745 [Chloroflexi bacterium 13_1_40CM_4_68_4]|nr:MAG: hypothetical protein AUH85_03745 [Chloroflexi bacterium 13_1_40CM_4_68_4]